MKLGLVLVGVFLVVAVLGPLLAPYSPVHGDLDARLLGPSAAHWLGTDENGVDLLSMLLHGARVALLVGVSTVVLSAAIGVCLGMLAGLAGGWLDELIMRVVDVLLAFPGMLLNLAIVAVVARPGLPVLVFALVLNGWVGYARVARAEVLSLRERDFVTAARALGASPARLLFGTLLPNLAGPLTVQASFGLGAVIATEAALAFLGLGPALPYTWGALLDQGSGQLWNTQRIAMVPGVAIFVVVLGSNLLGDGLRARLTSSSG
jgi:peptide/nickel transport system permease protein